MARNNSFVRLEGTLEGLTFYRKDGQNFVKTKSQVSRNRIMHSPEYQRTRENMQEFAGANRCGKSFREGFASILRVVADSQISSRVAVTIRRLMNSGAGLRGQRNINLVDNTESFIGFNFNKFKLFDSQFNAPSTGPTLSAGKDKVTWSIPDFETTDYIGIPNGATHCKLVLAAGYVSNYEWEPVTKLYEPVEETPNGIGGITYSNAIALGGMVGAATDLVVDLTAYAPIPVTTALYGATGIVFYQEVNGDLYELAQGHSMKIAVAG